MSHGRDGRKRKSHRLPTLSDLGWRLYRLSAGETCSRVLAQAQQGSLVMPPNPLHPGIVDIKVDALSLSVSERVIPVVVADATADIQG